MGQVDSRYGGGPALNVSVHSMLGPKWTFASSSERWRPFGRSEDVWPWTTLAKISVQSADLIILQRAKVLKVHLSSRKAKEQSSA